jgi:outer membrane protein TolC
MTQSKAAQPRSSAPLSREVSAYLQRPRAAVLTLALALGILAAAVASLSAQAPGSSSPGSGAASTTAASQAVASGQTNLYNASGSNGANVTSDTYKGSLITGANTGTILPLSLDDSINRGLKQNLGIILQSSATQSANGSRLEQLQQLLPTISAQASITVEQIDLAAFGLKIPNFNPIIGPFQVVDFRAYLTQNVINLNALQTYISSKHSFAAAKLTAQDARDLVVLTVGNAYLLCVADTSRIEAINAALKTAKLTYDQSVDSHDAGVSPRLDVLRAQVDYQNEQQSLISATNQLAKDKIALARAIGLPLDQQFALTDTAPYQSLDNLDPNLSFEQAVKTRKDLQAAEEQVKSAESARKAAYDDRLPVVAISGNFGDIGETPGHSHGTFTAEGQVTIPVLQIVKDRGEQEVANAALDQSKARLSDQTQQVNADIRSSILDIQSAAKLVEATKSNVDLATEALSEAQQRYHAGVADNLPVSQAQTTFEQANDQYISALYQHNVAKLSLARALGVAQTNYKDYLGGK